MSDRGNGGGDDVTAKEYVSQLIGINARIKTAEIELARLRSDKDQLGAMRYDAVRVSGGMTGDLSDFIIRTQEDVIKQYDKVQHLRYVKAEIERTVNSIVDGRLAKLLILRYEYSCKWGYIASVISDHITQVSENTVKGRMHGAALRDLDKILKSRNERNTWNIQL